MIKLKKEVLLDWDHLDGYISNVGNGQGSSIPIQGKDEWNESWKSNFESAVITTRTFLPIINKKKGVILFISSIAGLQEISAPTVYSTAKSAICAFAKNLSRKLGPNIRVNTIAPGNIFLKEEPGKKT